GSGAGRASRRSEPDTFSGLPAAGIFGWGFASDALPATRAASTALRSATVETIAFGDGFGVSSIRWWASRLLAVESSIHCPHSGHRTSSARARGTRISNVTTTSRRHRQIPAVASTYASSGDFA